MRTRSGDRSSTTRTSTSENDLEIWSRHRLTHLGGDGRLVIGDRVFLNGGVVILAFKEIEIGDDVALASEVFITDSDNPRHR